jgi:hypothetical protein
MLPDSARLAHCDSLLARHHTELMEPHVLKQVREGGREPAREWVNPGKQAGMPSMPPILATARCSDIMVGRVSTQLRLMYPSAGAE